MLLAFCAILLLPAASRAQAGAVEGTAYDSLRAQPLVRASVIASALTPTRDTVFHSALTDARGRFRIDGLPAGRYAITVEHESIDSLGFHVPSVDVAVNPTGLATVAIATPSVRTLRHVLCPESADDPNLGVILGVVRKLDGTPVDRATVVFAWNDFEVDQPSVSVIHHRVTANSSVNERGVYIQCNVPIQRSVFVQALGGDRVNSGILEERIGNAGFQVRDFRLATETAAINVAASGEPARGVMLTGIVVDVRDRPVNSAQLSLPGTGRTATTNDNGEFRFADLPLGTHSVEVMALGYYPRSLPVELDRSTAPLRIRLERTAVILDSLRVIAKRTTLTRRLGHEEFDARAMRGVGSYVTRAKLDSMRPMTVFDALRVTQGVKLAQPRGTDFIVSSSRGTAAFGATICPMDIFLDGMRMKQEDLRGIPPEVIYGIEVLGVATAPAKYKVGNCGGLFIWTR